MYIIYDNMSILLFLYSVVYVIMSILFDINCILNDKEISGFYFRNSPKNSTVK